MTSKNNPIAVSNGRITLSSDIKEAVLSAAQESYFVNNIDIFTYEFETLRKKLRTTGKQRRLLIRLLILFIFIGFIIVCMRQSTNLESIVTVVIVFSVFNVFSVFSVFFHLLIDPLRSRYNKKVKDKVFPVIFKYFGDAFIYSQTCPWGIKKMKGFNLLPFYDTGWIDGYIRGTYNNIEIEMVGMKLIQEGNKSSIIVFKGIYCFITLKKTFSGRVVVQRDAWNFRKPKGMQVVHLEDPEFSEAFKVYADDQIEARVLLTTSFMYRLLALGKRIGSQQVDCSFHSGKLLIRVPTDHDCFQVEPFSQTVNFRHEFKTITDDIQIIFDIVDGLQVDLDIGL